MRDYGGKCNCGKPVRYFHRVEGELEFSCNKYNVCPLYEELEKSLSSLRKSYGELLDAACDVLMFREGTDHYKEAENTIGGHTNAWNKD